LSCVSSCAGAGVCGFDDLDFFVGGAGVVVVDGVDGSCAGVDACSCAGGPCSCSCPCAGGPCSCSCPCASGIIACSCAAAAGVDARDDVDACSCASGVIACSCACSCAVAGICGTTGDCCTD